jgi:glucose-1-phosphate adenylyltransferase
MTVMVDYQRDHMADYLGQWGAANAGLTNIFVLQPEAGSYAGTADAVYQNLSYLNAQSGDKLLVLAGDHIYRMDYRDMIAFHEKVNADATVGVIRVPIEEAHRFGTVVTDAQGRIQEFVEKSSSPSSNLASMGIYVFNKDVISKRLVEDAGKSDSPHDFGYAILPEMVKRDRVFTYEFNGYWQDIGTVEAYYQANMELLVSRPRFSLDSNWPILGENSAPPALTESADGNIVNSLISPGCIIKGRVENSILSPGIRVEEQAIIRNSIIMANASVGYHSVIDNCILDEGVHVGQSCYIGFGSGLLPGNWDITVLGKDVIVPAHTAIGRKCKVLPKAGPGDFTASLIPAGTMVPA